MSRYLFVSDPLIANLLGAAVLPANQPFQLWTERTGGDRVTDCTATDGITGLPTTPDGASFLADGNGQPPDFRGPDGVVVLWIDAGAERRYPLAATDLLGQLLLAAIDWLGGSFPTGGGGGLPVGTTLDDIPNGVQRLALTLAQADKLATTPTTFLKVGTAATDAKPGNYNPTAKDVGGVTAMGMVGPRIWFGRTTTQGPPTSAEGAIPVTDYAFLDVG